MYQNLEGYIGVNQAKTEGRRNDSHQVRWCTPAIVYWDPVECRVAVSAVEDRRVREKGLLLPPPLPGAEGGGCGSEGTNTTLTRDGGH